MFYCELCGGKHGRFHPNSKKVPARYCSTKCIKRASYRRKHPHAKSFGVSEDFWATETGKGFKWEQYVAKKLNGEHLEFNKDGVDVRVDEGGASINIDVKVAEKYRNWWVFNKNKPKPHIHYYYCICLKGDKIVKELFIPSSKFRSGGISVGGKSAYDEFIFR